MPATIHKSLPRSAGKPNGQTDEIEVITSGDKLDTLDQNMGGGLPLGTANLAVGVAAAGKSVISQDLAWEHCKAAAEWRISHLSLAPMVWPPK